MYCINQTIKNEINCSKFLLSEIKKLKYPRTKGTMICKFKNGQVYYYNQYKDSHGKRKQKYLGIKTSKEVQLHMQKKYNDILERKLAKNITILESILPKVEQYDPDAIVDKMPNAYRNDEYRTKKHNINFQFETNLQEPQLSDIPISKPMPKNANITVDGTPVRSKGEVIIYNMLKYYHIPFKYEQGIKLMTKDGTIVVRYPDFLFQLPNGKKKYCNWR